MGIELYQEARIAVKTGVVEGDADVSVAVTDGPLTVTTCESKT